MTEYPVSPTPTPSGQWVQNAEGTFDFYRGGSGGPGKTGQEGPQGPAGADGSGITVKGSATYATIIATPNPTAGDLWVQTDTTAEGSAGDGWVYDGATWDNTGPFRGPQGPQGIQGVQGQQGVKGDQGDPGPTGTQGPGGDSAYQVWLSEGNSGTEADFLADIEGPQGPQGVQGTQGDQGIQGVVGPEGPQGPIGPEGPQGVKGDTGAGATIQGSLTYAQIIAVSNPFVGDLYIQTDDTVEGDPGDGWVWTGASWENVGPIRGPQGPQGVQGPQGPQGVKGDTGDQGATGPTGSAASVAVGSTATGAPGSNAAVSNSGTTSAAVLDFTVPRGATGAQGPAGSDGADGSAGADGDDAYEVAVAQGFVGTRQEWLDSLVGPQGQQGIQGIQGPQGVTGDEGPQGPQGDQGIQGIQGDVGADGAAATVAVGTTSTGNAGTNAAVSNSGSSSAAVLDFTVPRGDAGEQGPQGVKGDTGDQGIQGIQGPQGVKGDTGDQGIQGATGPEGPTAVSADAGNLAKISPTDSLIYVTDNPLGEREVVGNIVIRYDQLTETLLATELGYAEAGTDTADTLWYEDPRPAVNGDIWVIGATRDYVEFDSTHTQDPDEPDVLSNGIPIPDKWIHIASQEWFVSRAGDTMYGPLETPSLKADAIEVESGVFGESNLGNAMASGLQVDGQASVTSLEVSTPEGSTRAQIDLGNDYRIQRLIATDGKRYLWVSPIASDLIGAGSYTIGPTASGDIDAQIRLRAESVTLEHQGFFSDFNAEWKSISATGGFVDYGGSYAMRYRVAGNVLYLDGLLKGYASGTTFGYITETGIGSRLPYNTLLNCQHSNSGMIRVDVTKVSNNQLRLATTGSSGGIIGNAPISTGFINLNNAIPLANGFGYPPTAGGSGGSGGGSLTTYTTTFPATWWRAYQSNNTLRTDSHSHVYQGRYSTFWGNLRSLVGYNVSVPAGAKAVSGYMTIDWEHWYSGSGGTAYFYPHAHASAPSTFSVQSNTAWTYKFSTANPGAINVPLPANIVTQLLSGYTKGITVGPAPSDSVSYYGYAKPTPSITLRYQA